MTHNFNQGMILMGSNFAWLHIKKDGVIQEVVFDNLQSANYKIKRLAAGGGGENIDITRADGAVIRFSRQPLTIDGTTGNEITAVEETASKGEIILTINQSPFTMAGANPTYMRWTEFIKFLRDNADAEFLVTIGTGHTHTTRTSTTRKPDGFCYMIGKISNDIEQNLDANAGSISLTFVAKENSNFVAGDLSGNLALYSAVTDRRGGGDKDFTGIKPTVITEQMETTLLAGEVALALGG